jgi:hypothetical protein
MKGKRARAETGNTDGVGRAILSRRKVLGGIGGLAAIPVLYGIGAATPAVSATKTDAAAVLAHSAGRTYNAPQLEQGTRLVLPPGINAVSIQDYYHRPHLASAETAWPNVIAADGTMVDASTVPRRGAPTCVAMLSGFSTSGGWYEIIHANGRADRVMWDANKFPVLRLYAEYGATRQHPLQDRWYTLALRPFSRNPYSHGTLAS